MVTHYDVLGVPNSARTEEIRHAYLAKAKQLHPDRFSGATEDVQQAVAESMAIVNEAWRVLSDARLRADYDQSLGHATADGHTQVHEPTPGTEGLDFDEPGPPNEMFGVLPLYGVKSGMQSLAEWLSPEGKTTHHVVVPDICGMKASQAHYTVAMADLHLSTLHLTANPAPVDGTVVDQDPPAGTSVRRFSTLTAQVWHPSADETTLTKSQ